MLEVDDILPKPLTPLVLAPTVAEPVCEIQTPAVFTMAQSYPQPHSVDTANYARLNPLPSPATSSSSSGDLNLYIVSGTSSPSVPTGLQSSSEELLFHGQVPQPPQLFSTAHTAVFTTQPPIQPTSIPSWADEVATVEQSGHSTPETVVPNWAYSGRIRGARPQSQPLVYPPPVMPTPHTQRPPVPSPRYGPALPPLRPQQSFTQQPTYNRPTSTDNYPCTDPSPRRATPDEIYLVRSSPIQASQSPARNTASPSRGPQPSSSRGRPNPFAPSHGIPHRSQGPNFRFQKFRNTLGINTIQGIHVPERISYTSTPPQHTLKPRASSCSLGQLENEYVLEGRDKDFPLYCLNFPLNPSSWNGFGICLSTCLHMQVAQTITLIPSLLATLNPTKLMLNTTPFIYKSVF